jgi:hypothetical protein
MHIMHPTVLIGPADWNPKRLPKEVFLARIAALFESCGGADAALVYGDPFRHAELLYLTNCLPKLDRTIALIPRNGAPRLLFGGGASMIGSVRPLTWIEELEPLRGSEGPAQWLRQCTAAGQRVVLVGGDYMPEGLRRSLIEVGCPLEDVTACLRAIMRRKGPHETALMRTACRMLQAAAKALADAHAAGQDAASVVLAAEHAARQNGAQDVRTLFSLDGGRSFRPFEIPVKRHVDPLPVYLAVRHCGYWADSFLYASSAPQTFHTSAQRALRAALDLAKAGVRARVLGDAIRATLGPFSPHPLTVCFGNGIGLDLHEPPQLHMDGDETLEAGAIYSLRVGTIADTHGTNVSATNVSGSNVSGAIASALIFVGEKNTEVLWPTEVAP